MRKHKLAVSMFVFAMTGMLTACGNDKTAETLPAAETAVETAVETTSETSSAAPEDSADDITSGSETNDDADVHEATLPEITALLGMDDEAAATYFGGGEENWNADHSLYIGRIYEVRLFDETYPLYTSCDDEKKAASVSVWLSSGEETLPEDAAEIWIERISDFAGSEPIDSRVSSESGSSSWKWRLDGSFISLVRTGDIMSINITPAVGELK